MKNYYFILTIFLSIFSFSQNRPLIIEVESDENGDLSLPIFYGTQTYIYTLKVTENPSIIIKDAIESNTSILTIEDLAVNTAYDLEILNYTDIPLRIKLGRTQAKKLKQWGDIIWSNDMSYFASGALYYNYSDFEITANDIPDFSNVTNMEAMFQLTTSSNIPNIDKWDVSNVTNMAYMFRWSEFNQDISIWDVSKVENMNNMFSDSPFNQEVKTVISENGKKYWDVSNVEDMGYMFANSPFDRDISNWTVSKVKDMSYMFNASKFNHPIGNWDVSNVTNMAHMFSYSTFNQSIGNWNVSNVTNMAYMFDDTKAFNQPIGNWNVSNVTNMKRMFNGTLFNNPLGNWNVSKVEDMEWMFRGTPFNYEISLWITSTVTTMESMFEYSHFNQPIGDWDVSNVTNMTYMFSASQFNQDIGNWTFGSPNLIVDLRGSKIDCENLSKTFIGWYNNINTRAIANQLNAQGLRYNRTALEAYNKLFNTGGNQTNPGAWTINPYVDEENPDPDRYAPEYLEFCGLEPNGAPFIIEVESDENGDLSLPIFDGTPSYIYRLKQLNIEVRPTTSSVASTLTIDGLNINTAYDLEILNNTDTNGDIPLRIKLGNYAKKIKQWGSVLWNEDMSSFADGAVDLIVVTDEIVTEINGVQETIPDMPELGHVTNLSNMFKEAGINVSQPDLNTFFSDGKWKINHIGDWEIQSVNNMSSMFENSAFDADLDEWEIIDNVTNFSDMFKYSKFNSIPFQLYTSGNTNPLYSINMSGMFYLAESFNQTLNNWNVSNVTTMSAMFMGASSFNQPLNNWNVSKVENMGSMFYGARSFDQPLNNWDVSKVTNMHYMFHDARSFNQPLNNWNVSNVTTMSDMFYAATSFNQSLNNWDVSNVTTMSAMFFGATSFNQPLNNWDVSNVTNMNRMFGSAISFNKSLDNWNLAAVTNTYNMLDNGVFNQNLGSWAFGDQSFVLDLDGSAIDCNNMSLSLIGWDNSSNNKTITLKASTLSYNQSAYEAYRNLFIEEGHAWNVVNNVGPTYDENCGVKYCLKPKTDGSIIPILPKMVINTLKSGNNSPAEQMSDSYNGFVSLTKGFVLTHVAKSEDIINPIEGMLIYELEDACIKMYSPNGNTLEWNCISRTCNDSF